MTQKEEIRLRLRPKVEDKTILEELIAINLLPFIKETIVSCSGHCNRFGLLQFQQPYFRIQYVLPEHPAQKFHKELQSIKVDIEGRKYGLRPLDTRYEYTIITPMRVDPDKDTLIGPKVDEIPVENPAISYNFIIPQSFNFEDPGKRNVKILEQFWNEISALLSRYHHPIIYQRRTFTYENNPNGTINSPFIKEDNSGLLF